MGGTGAHPSGCLGFPGPRTLLNVLMISFLHALQATFREQASRPALVHHGFTWTYGELDARAQHGATWLQSLGVAVGDRVVLCTSNKLAFLLAHLATLWAGAISLPLNPRFTRAELRFFLSDSGARIAIAGDEARPLLESLRPELPDLRAIVPDTVVGDRGTLVPTLRRGNARFPRRSVGTRVSRYSAPA